MEHARPSSAYSSGWGNRNGFRYRYILVYYPTKYEVEEEFQVVRKIVWNFKDGLVSEVIGNALAKDFESLGLTPPINHWWLSVIPASTLYKTESRFKEFCRVYCSLTGINNGYNLIEVKEDREAKHLKQDRNSVTILDKMNFGIFTGKRILLFDDIYTTGKSFSLVASKLRQLGALEVVGLFLGKTHWLDE